MNNNKYITNIEINPQGKNITVNNEWLNLIIKTSTIQKIMGVVTTADRKLDEAKEHIDLAYKSLFEALDPDTWGSDEFNKEYTNRMESALYELLRIKREL